MAKTPAGYQQDSIELAGMRDASWYNRPGRASRCHIMTTEATAACNPRIPLTETVKFAEDVPTHMRCQRPGCQRRWPR